MPTSDQVTPVAEVRPCRLLSVTGQLADRRDRRPPSSTNVSWFPVPAPERRRPCCTGTNGRRMHRHPLARRRSSRCCDSGDLPPLRRKRLVVARVPCPSRVASDIPKRCVGSANASASALGQPSRRAGRPRKLGQRAVARTLTERSSTIAAQAPTVSSAVVPPSTQIASTRQPSSPWPPPLEDERCSCDDLAVRSTRKALAPRCASDVNRALAKDQLPQLLVGRLGTSTTAW